MAWIYQIGDTVPWANYDTTSQVINNTWEAYNYLNALGFSIQSICGIIGNMRYESYLNPGQQELNQGGSLSYGYGLIQWTPATSLINFVSGNWYDGNLQMDLVVREIRRDPDVTGRWIPTSDYPYYYNDFISLTSIDTATRAYFHERERGTWATERLQYANESYQILTGTPPGPDPPGPTPGSDIEVMTCLLLFDNRRVRK